MSSIDETIERLAKISTEIAEAQANDERLLRAARFEVERLTRERDAERASKLRAWERPTKTEEATLIADRDHLAAALAEVREAATCPACAGTGYTDWRRMREGRLVSNEWRTQRCQSCHDGVVPGPRLRAALAATPADLLAARDARVRAEALRDAAGAYGREAEPEAAFVRDWLRAEAERIERGDR